MTPKTATLNGVVSPNRNDGKSVYYYWEVEGVSEGEELGGKSLPSGISPVEVSLPLTGFKRSAYPKEVEEVENEELEPIALGSEYGLHPGAYAMHWDGSKWTNASAILPHELEDYTESELTDVFCTSASFCMTAGLDHNAVKGSNIDMPLRSGMAANGHSPQPLFRQMHILSPNTGSEACASPASTACPRAHAWLPAATPHWNSAKKSASP